jgi:hypothetical protein
LKQYGVVLQAEPQRPVRGHLEGRRYHEERLVVEIVEVISDDLVEREPGGAGLWSTTVDVWSSPAG